MRLNVPLLQLGWVEDDIRGSPSATELVRETTIALVIVCRQAWKTTFAVPLANWFKLGEDDLYDRLTVVKTIPNVSRCSLAGKRS